MNIKHISLLFSVSKTFSEAMCKLIKVLLDDKIINSNIIMEKLPLHQLMNSLTSAVSIFFT